MRRRQKELQVKLVPSAIADNMNLEDEGLCRKSAEEICDLKILAFRDEAREIFVNAILNPPEPNKALRLAAARYRKWEDGQLRETSERR
jgi:hypothetical protein